LGFLRTLAWLLVVALTTAMWSTISSSTEHATAGRTSALQLQRAGGSPGLAAHKAHTNPSLQKRFALESSGLVVVEAAPFQLCPREVTPLSGDACAAPLVPNARGPPASRSA
jgi:hypothetical protein